MTRIALIGAGSVEFTRILLADLSDFPELAEATVVLHDIDSERLRTAERIVAATNAATGATFGVESHLDRREALEGADFVVNEIQVGGLEATMRDFEIPKSFGLRQTIGDTLGVGGVFRALRTIPVVLEIAADIAEVCPDATFLNYTNPMAMLMWAVWEGSPLRRAVGLCHSVQNTHELLGEIVVVPVEAIDFSTAGVNHQAFVLRFERDGESLYPALDSEIERYRIPVDEYVRRSRVNVAEYEDLRRRLDAGEPLDVMREGELAPRYIHSIVTGQERIEYGLSLIHISEPTRL